MTEIADPAGWWAAGGSLEVACSTGGGGPHRVFTRVQGEGPWLTVLHGFPTSSLDFAGVVARLAAERRLLCLDFIGFGESDRPLDHLYSIEEQADAVEAVWAAHGVTATGVLAHDYGDSVAQELLWRSSQGRGTARLDFLVLANGGIYPDLHRPQPAQLALLDPEQGPALAAAIDGAGFAAVLEPTFAPGRMPDPAGLGRLWQAQARGGGTANLHLLIRYIDDRRRRERDWVGALEGADLPLGFVWGMLDPISGAHIAERILERFPAATIRRLDGVGHWPPLEAPDEVASVAGRVAATAGR